MSKAKHVFPSYFILTTSLMLVALSGCLPEENSDSSSQLALESSNIHEDHPPHNEVKSESSDFMQAQASNRLIVDSMNMTEIVGAHAMVREVSLCEYSQLYDIGGEFEVVEIRSSYESDKKSSKEAPSTYITFKLISDWFNNSPQTVVARISGGYFPDGRYLPPRVSLEKGEVIAAFFYDVERSEKHGFYNNGYHQLTNHLQIFREVSDNLYSNGQHFFPEGTPITSLRNSLLEARKSQANCEVSNDPSLKGYLPSVQP
ncbi:hypothetical protein [Lujinxingia litoralis]|uniref:hypothetical protein n=1 Tax=Lujinxingia litoralis TaxID=2211119 RepID=UPI0011B946AF|nr:hypothetical protein [Lujinxingia litoralis]